MKKLLILLFLGFTLVGFSQITQIPDTNFEQALIDLGYDTAPINGSIPTANISNVPHLNVFDSDISDLTGIEDFTALAYLGCSFNQLTSLDISNNTALTTLHCRNNQLTSLDVTNNTALIYLYCNSNQLTSLDVTNNTALSGLFCDYNQLTNIDVTNNTALSSLSCENNQLTNIDVTNNTALSSLSCENNQLTNIDVTNNTALSSLSCENNQLINIDVTNNTALSSLSCDGNQLTNIDVTNNTALDILVCDGNQLTSLDLSNNIVLRWLTCSNNQLTSLDVRNGYNTNIQDFVQFNSTVNPNLTCIYVDDADYSNANWPNIDPNSTFVNNEAECEALNIGDNALELDVTIYPNPTDNYLFVEGNKNPISISIYNLLGAEVITKSATDKINVIELSKGVYIIRISDGVNQTDKKFIKN